MSKTSITKGIEYQPLDIVRPYTNLVASTLAGTATVPLDSQCGFCELCDICSIHFLRWCIQACLQSLAPSADFWMFGIQEKSGKDFFNEILVWGTSLWSSAMVSKSRSQHLPGLCSRYKPSHSHTRLEDLYDLEDVNAGQSRHQKSAPTAIVKDPRRQGIIRWLPVTHAGTRVKPKRNESLCKCKQRISTYLHLYV